MRIVLVNLRRVAAATALAVLLAPATVAGDSASAQGCMDQWLFNGVWRVQITKVEPLMDGATQTGWKVTEVWRNGTSQEISPGDTLLQDQTLTLGTGAIKASATTRGSLSMQTIAAHSFQGAAQFSYVQEFLAQGTDPSNKPAALDIAFDAAKLAQNKNLPHFTSAHYDFHFKLDCTASGAAAQAQGGSNEVAASEGCMNQWMSNGVWRMRATAIAPDSNNDPAGPQIGWMITQDWANVTSKPLAPADVNMTDQQLITASGNTTSSTNSAGTSMNFQQLTFHTFPADGTFTYQQRFRWSPLDPSDKPVKLLITFNDKVQNQRVNSPHYTRPANFRISLTCTK